MSKVKDILAPGDADAIDPSAQQRAFEQVFSKRTEDSVITGKDINDFSSSVEAEVKAEAEAAALEKFNELSVQVTTLTNNLAATFDDAKNLRMELMDFNFSSQGGELLSDENYEKIYALIGKLQQHQKNNVVDKMKELIAPILDSIKKQLSEITKIDVNDLPQSLQNVTAKIAGEGIEIPGGIEMQGGSILVNVENAVNILNEPEGIMRFIIAHELGHLVDLTIKDPGNTELAAKMDGNDMFVTQEDVVRAYEKLGFGKPPEGTSVKFLEVLADVFAAKIFMNSNLQSKPNGEDIREATKGPDDGDHPSGEVREALIKELSGHEL